MFDSLQFEAVIDELGINLLKERKGWWQGSCPLDSHGGPDLNPSFGVNEEELLFNCWVCGGGKLPELVIRLLHLEDDVDDPIERSAWQQALEWLLPFTDHNPNFDKVFVERIRGYFKSAEKPSKTRRHPPLPYLSPSILQGFKIAPISLFEKWHIKKQATIDAFGIVYDPERFRIKRDIEHVGPALIIPHWFGGRLVGFQERWLGELPPKFPKYTNSTDFPKEETLFNWDYAKTYRKIITVESVMTTVRLFELGLVSVSTFGGSINPRQIQLLGTFDLVSIGRDNDRTGARYQTRLGKELSPLTNVEVLPPPRIDKGDLADLEDNEILELVALSRPFAIS